jgi:hypothetical protein
MSQAPDIPNVHNGELPVHYDKSPSQVVKFSVQASGWFDAGHNQSQPGAKG